VNLVGGQDELVFDGQSFAVNAKGHVMARASAFSEDLLICELDAPESSAGVKVVANYVRDETRARAATVNRLEAPLDTHQEIYDALVMGTRDYLRKNGFREAIVALSGGVDSSLVAAIAVDAVGARAVRGFAMPSRFSSDLSLEDASELCDRLDIELVGIPIEDLHRTFSLSLAPVLGDEPEGLTDENLQSRIRGVLMMALSNATGAIVLTTGNKSEMAVGSVLEKAPTAELRPDQRDDQSLPPYDVLDPMLELYVEDDATAEEIIALGYDRALVTRITRLVDRSEYKRRQTPPGVRISKKAFGRDRRMPITNAFRPEA